MNVHTLWLDIQQWKSTISTIAQQPESVLPHEPDDPKPFTLSPSEHMYAFTNLQPETVRELADEYGVDVADILRLLAYNPNYTEQELRAILERYRRKQAQYPGASRGALLLALAMNLPDTVLAYLTHLNDKQTNLYLKGNPGDNVYADILAAIQVQSIQETKAEISTLQSAIQKARAKKGSNLTQQEIIDAVNSTGIPWSSLPAELQRFLLGKSGMPYKYAYGLLIGHMVVDKFKAEYTSIYAYYIMNLDFKYREQFGKSGLFPDFQFTEDGQTMVVEDITSQGYMSTKQKYLSLPDILIAIGY